MTKLRLFACLAVALFAAGCSAHRVHPPRVATPDLEYETSPATTEALWDAALDFVAGEDPLANVPVHHERLIVTSFDVLPGPLHRKRNVRLWFDRIEPVRNPAASVYADCGKLDGKPLAGWGNLIAEVAIRVRPTEEGAGVGVVVRRMWQEGSPALQGRDVILCASTGELEARLRRKILDRVEAREAREHRPRLRWQDPPPGRRIPGEPGRLRKREGRPDSHPD